MMCVNDATVKNVACLAISSVISFLVLKSKTSLKAIRKLSLPIRIRKKKILAYQNPPFKSVNCGTVQNRKFMKETCSQSDWRPACPEGHSSLYLVEFVSANVVWFSSS